MRLLRLLVVDNEVKNLDLDLASRERTEDVQAVSCKLGLPYEAGRAIQD
jgi:hypothetical protein